MFQPLTNAIDVISGTTGLLLDRIGVPVTLANVYDGLAIDETDNQLYMITTTGIAYIDLNSLPSNALQIARQERHLPPSSSRSLVDAHHMQFQKPQRNPAISMARLRVAKSLPKVTSTGRADAARIAKP